MSNRLLFTRNLIQHIKCGRHIGLLQQELANVELQTKRNDLRQETYPASIHGLDQKSDIFNLNDIQLACKYWQSCGCFEKPFLFKADTMTQLSSGNTFDENYLESKIENQSFLSNNHVSMDYYKNKMEASNNNSIVYTSGKKLATQKVGLRSRKLLLSSNRKVNKPSSNHPSEEQLHELYQRLSEEVPSILKNGIDYNTHTKDILFDNEFIKLKTRGLLPYKIQTKLMLFLIKLWWSGKKFEILKITRHDFDGTIRIRWQLTGQPRILTPLILCRGVDNLQSDPQRSIDGFSILFVNKNGFIDYHKLSKMMPTTSEPRKTALASLLSLLGLSSKLRPTNQLPDEPVTQSQ